MQIIRFDEIDSTNEEAKRRIESGQAEPALIVAEQQTAGRGRRGRAWSSPVGNIYATFMEPLDEPTMQAANRGFVLSLSVCEALTNILQDRAIVAVKWPNDVLIDDAKVSGILLEIATAPDGTNWLISGFGVNVMHAPTDTPYPATAVISHVETDAVTVLMAIAERYQSWIAEYKAKGFGPIGIAWLKRATRLGQAITANLPDGSKLTGVFEGLNASGALLLIIDNEVLEVHAADIYFPQRAA